MTRTTSLAPLLERFFTQRLMQQRQASPHTISSYRDTFRQFLIFAQQCLARPPSRLTFEQIDAPLITAFLEELETHRSLSTRSRNLRLTAIHSFFRYAAFELPTHAAQIQRVLAIPSKRFTRNLVSFLSRLDVDALLAAPDRSTWSGRRDHAFILTAVQTGLRLSEMTRVKREDFVSEGGAHLRVVGKGRKERCTPLAKPTRAVLKAWLREPPRGRQRRALCERQRRTADRPWGSVSVEQAPRHSLNEMPLVETSAADCPPLATHRGHGPSSGRRRPRGDRLVARTRIGVIPSSGLRGSRCSPTPLCDQTSVRTTTIRHHTERDPATTAHNARLLFSELPSRRLHRELPETLVRTSERRMQSLLRVNASPGTGGNCWRSAELPQWDSRTLDHSNRNNTRGAPTSSVGNPPSHQQLPR